MKLILHDLQAKDFKKWNYTVEEDDVVVACAQPIKNCIGCFGCWIKTPGQCVLRDGYQNIGELLAKSSELVIITKCTYGGYSPQVKTVIDRSISFVLPFFVTKKDETHHQQRYQHTYEMNIYFYGEKLSEHEIQLARKLVEANNKNFYTKGSEAHFIEVNSDFTKMTELTGGAIA